MPLLVRNFFLETFENPECGLAAAVAESLGRSGIVVDILAAMPSEAEPQNYGARRSESHRLSATAAAQPRGTIRVSSCYLFVRQAGKLRSEEQQVLQLAL